MTIHLIFGGRFPSEKAASLFVAKNAEEFSLNGARVELVVPRRLGRKDLDPYSFYSVKKNFTVKLLPVLDLFFIPVLSKIAFYVSNITFSISLFFYFLRIKEQTVVYSNEPLPLIVVSLVKKNIYYEMHDFPEKNFWLYSFLFARVRGVIIHNKWKQDRALQKWNLAAEKILVEQNAVEVDDFSLPLSKKEARKKLSLPEFRQILVYTGHLYGWKGVDTLAEAAKILPSVYVCFVGGTDKDVTDFRNRYKDFENINIVGYRRHSEIPVWQKAADVLILPNSAKENISKYYTSPMKLYEYLASGRPIVASRLPSIEEISDERVVEFFAPDDPIDLAAKIQNILLKLNEHNPQMQLNLAAQHSWLNRSGRILSFIKSCLN